MPDKETEIIYANRGCNDGYCDNNHHGWASGWGAVGGALVGGGFGAAAVSIWDKINDTKADVMDVKSTVKESTANIYKDISDAARSISNDVNGVGKEVLGNRFTTERGLCDLGYKINSDIRDSREASNGGFQRIMDRLCNMEHRQDQCCCETNQNIKEAKAELALQLERCCCDLKRGQDEILCLIKDQAKDNEISRLTRELAYKDHRDILNAIEASRTTTPAAAAAAVR